MPQSVLEMTKELVSAQIRSGRLAPEEMQGALRRIYQSMMSLKSSEAAESSVSAADTGRARADWRTSITQHALICLECGQTLKQLSRRHLRQHNLDARSYRAKYVIPPSQSLAAREITAKRRRIAAEVKPWETAPTYVKAQEQKAATAKKAGRKKGTGRR